MESNNIIGLLFILIIFFIVTDYCKKKRGNNIEAFEDDVPVNCDNEDTYSDNDISHEEKINCRIKKLKKARKDLKEAVSTQENNKYKNNIEYYKKINDAIEKKHTDSNQKRSDAITNSNTIITSIKEKLAYLNNFNVIDMPHQEFNSIRSLQNGTKLVIEKNKDGDDYLVKLNKDNDTEKCLSVNSNGTYNLEKCDPGSDSDQQKFDLVNITNDSMYKNNLEKGILSNKTLPAIVNYPFNLIKSKKNKNCVGIFNNELSVTPCETKKSHRWEPLEEHIYCPRDENE
tara:strand:+ start:78 stop:935 length:858 start_codon:yes stop_codon:yes gene_type:complete